MDLNTTIKLFHQYLEYWYQQRGKKSVQGWDLSQAKDNFMIVHPQCKAFDSDIHFNFMVKEGSYQRACLCGCTKNWPLGTATCTGVTVSAINWGEICELAGLENYNNTW